MPTISISSPTFTTPCSTRPVTTVPRPVIENTSSTGIRNGLSSTRTGSGIDASSASISSSMHSFAASSFGFAQRLRRAAANDRRVVARELVLRQQLPHFELHQLEQLRVVHHVALVQEHHEVRHVHLARQQHVLARLRHRTVRRAHHQDRAVHLRRARDHVLHVVRVARAVHVRVVPVRRLVLHVRRRDRDPALPLLRRLVDLIERHEVRQALLRLTLRDRRRQRRLAVVHVTNRPHVHVRLRPLELRLAHVCSSLSLAVYDFRGDRIGYFRVVGELHRVGRATLRHRAQAVHVAEHRRERHVGAHEMRARARPRCR